MNSRTQGKGLTIPEFRNEFVSQVVLAVFSLVQHFCCSTSYTWKSRLLLCCLSQLLTLAHCRCFHQSWVAIIFFGSRVISLNGKNLSTHALLEIVLTSM